MRYRICKECGELFNTETPCHPEDSHRNQAHYVQADIQPYESMITHEMITSRSHHRSHMRQHGVIEAGNEQKYFMNMDKAQEVDRNDAKRREIEAKYGPEISKRIDKLIKEH